MKQNKIIVVVCPEDKLREELIATKAVKLGFARTPFDAAKIVRTTVHDYDLTETYFVLAKTYNFRESPITTQRLFELASRGIAVVVGVKRLPPEFELFCEASYN